LALLFCASPRSFSLDKMSFQQYEGSFQGPQAGEQPGAPGGNGVPPQQNELGQAMDNGAGGFPGGNMGQPGPAQQQQGADGKTTLW
jgi:hypothetical protein